MQIPTVRLAKDGGTYFDVTEMPFTAADFTPPSPAGYETTPPFPAKAFTVMRTPAGYVDEWHPAPYKVLTIVLSGVLRLETSDGDSRVFKPGDLCINEDIEGHGHRLTEEKGQSYEILLVELSVGSATTAQN